MLEQSVRGTGSVVSAAARSASSESAAAAPSDGSVPVCALGGVVGGAVDVVVQHDGIAPNLLARRLGLRNQHTELLKPHFISRNW